MQRRQPITRQELVRQRQRQLEREKETLATLADEGLSSNENRNETTIDTATTNPAFSSLEEVVYRLCKDEMRLKILSLIGDFITSTWNMHFEKHLREQKAWETFNDKDFKLIFNLQLVNACANCLLSEINKKLASNFTIEDVKPIIIKILKPFSSTKENKLIYIETMKEWWTELNNIGNNKRKENFEPIKISIEMYKNTKAAIEHLPYNSNTKALILKQLFNEKITFLNGLTENKFCIPKSQSALFDDVVKKQQANEPYVYPFRLITSIAFAYIWMFYFHTLAERALNLPYSSPDEELFFDQVKKCAFIGLSFFAATLILRKYIIKHKLDIDNRHFMDTFITDRLLKGFEELLEPTSRNTSTESRSYPSQLEYKTYSPNPENKSTTQNPTTTTTASSKTEDNGKDKDKSHKTDEKRDPQTITTTVTTKALTTKDKLLAEIKAAREENAANAHDHYFQVIKWIDDENREEQGDVGPKEYIYDYLDNHCPIVPLYTNDMYLKASSQYQYLFFDKPKIKELTDYKRDKTLYKIFKHTFFGTSEKDPNISDPGHVVPSQGAQGIVRTEDQYKIKIQKKGFSHNRLEFIKHLSTVVEVDVNGNKVQQVVTLHVPYAVTNTNQKK